MNIPIPKRTGRCLLLIATVLSTTLSHAATELFKPYDEGCTERQEIFEFTQKPSVKALGNDKYEIAFAVKGYCDVTVGLIDKNKTVVRHLGSGVLGKNAPKPFQKNALKQIIYWDGKNDLGAYVKSPTSLRVQVRLGLKPVFDKRLGGTSPKNIPGYIWGIATHPGGAYVFYKGKGAHGHVGIRAFNQNGDYIRSLVPPPANVPSNKWGGLGYIEYQKGVRAPHDTSLHETLTSDSHMIPGVGGKGVRDCQPALIGKRLYVANPGHNSLTGNRSSKLLYWNTDGSTDLKGISGTPFAPGTSHTSPILTASPDGKWIYMIGFLARYKSAPGVLRFAINKSKKAEPFVGVKNIKSKYPYKFSPGSDTLHLNEPSGLDCDAQGRVYVSDRFNNRIQIFSSEGTFLKSVSIKTPGLLRVHQRTGEIYVFHFTRIQGKSVGRLSRISAFPELKKSAHWDGMLAAVFALDSWSDKPRLWTGGEKNVLNSAGSTGTGPSIVIWEDHGKDLKKLQDFDQEAKKEAGKSYFGRHSGTGFSTKVVCDQIRERLYYGNSRIFDLRSGAFLGKFRVHKGRTFFDDLAIDKNGFMHVHFNPTFYMKGVGRIDLNRPEKLPTGDWIFPEVPYDYGINYGISKTGDIVKTTWKGILPTKDQSGPKGFQQGIGVNMRGDVAEECDIFYVPKMDDIGSAAWASGPGERKARGAYVSDSVTNYKQFLRSVQERQKKGETVYFIPRIPGRPLTDGTIWTFEKSGELRAESAVVSGKKLVGPNIDEEGFLYFTNGRIRAVNGKPFLQNLGGRLGDDTFKNTPFTGTYMKTKGKAWVISDKAAVPLDPLPDRACDLFWKNEKSWVIGAEWLYAGASPVRAGGCYCPTQRPFLDWYKRSFVPESYRHSIGVLDTNGNLILHIGRYGNFDSLSGSASEIPVGGDDIGHFVPRCLAGTDNYLTYDVWGEALMVLKLDYHAEHIVKISRK